MSETQANKEDKKLSGIKSALNRKAEGEIL